MSRHGGGEPACGQRADSRACRCTIQRLSAGAVQRIGSVQFLTQFANVFPLRARATGQRMRFGRDLFECLRIPPLGVDFQQLAVNRNALRRCAHRFLEDFLGLQVTAISQVHIGFRDGVDVPGRIELAR